MAADLKPLVPEFGDKLEHLLAVCRERGVEMRPYFAIRSPFEQARLWRQSRSREEIEARIADLRAQNAPFLAHCLESVGPQNGPPVTNAIPALSWHQWGEAVDSFWAQGGKAEWSTTKEVDGVNGYRVYAAAAAEVGLDAGGLWRRLKDWPHVQLRAEGSPAAFYSIAAIAERMKRVFGPQL